MDSDTTTPTSRLRHLLPLCALLTLAACEAGTGDTDDATSAGATTTAPGETDAPTTGAAQTTGADTTTGADATTSDATTADATTSDATTADATTDATTTDDSTTGEPVEAPEIAGMYTDEYGSMHTIDAAAWTLDTSVFHVLVVDNATDHLVAENDAQNEFFPALFSRFDWHVDADDVYYCQTAYDAPTQADAEATEPADADDLVMGCAGFPWTLLTP